MSFIPHGLEWNGKEEGFYVKWLSYLVLFTDRFSFAIQALTPTLFCLRQNWVNRYIQCSFEYLLELQSDSLIYKSLQFISFGYLLELRSDSLIYFLWKSFRITIGFVNLYRSSTKLEQNSSNSCENCALRMCTHYLHQSKKSIRPFRASVNLVSPYKLDLKLRCSSDLT